MTGRGKGGRHSADVGREPRARGRRRTTAPREPPVRPPAAELRRGGSSQSHVVLALTVALGHTRLWATTEDFTPGYAISTIKSAIQVQGGGDKDGSSAGELYKI